MSYESMLNSTMTVQTMTETFDAINGSIQTWADSTADNPCRMRLLNEKERVLIGREGNVSTHRLYCLASVTLTAGDRITNVKLSGAGTDTRVFDIVSVNNVDEDGRVVQVDMIQRV